MEYTPLAQRQLEGLTIFGYVGVFLILTGINADQTVITPLKLEQQQPWTWLMSWGAEYWGALILIGCLFIVLGLDPQNPLFKKGLFKLVYGGIQFFVKYKIRTMITVSLVLRMIGNTIHLFIALVWAIPSAWEVLDNLLRGESPGSHILLFLLSFIMGWRSASYWIWNLMALGEHSGLEKALDNARYPE